MKEKSHNDNVQISHDNDEWSELKMMNIFYENMMKKEGMIDEDEEEEIIVWNLGAYNYYIKYNYYT